MPGPRRPRRCRSWWNGGRLSEHFHMDEFRSQGNGMLRIDRAVIRSCEATRTNLGGPLGILSG